MPGLAGMFELRAESKPLRNQPTQPLPRNMPPAVVHPNSQPWISSVPIQKYLSALSVDLQGAAAEAVD